MSSPERPTSPSPPYRLPWNITTILRLLDFYRVSVLRCIQNPAIGDGSPSASRFDTVMTSLPSPPTTPVPVERSLISTEGTSATENSLVSLPDEKKVLLGQSAQFESLTSRIDSLLITYLSHLDAYVVQREILSNSFRFAYFSLARANANAAGNLGYGRRYGAERYDERMKASKRVRWHSATAARQDIATQDQDGRFPNKRDSQVERCLDCQIYNHLDDEKEDKDQGKVHAKLDEPLLPTSEAVPEGTKISGSSEKELEIFSLDKVQNLTLPSPSSKWSKAKKVKDPIHQFGILVPQSLRDAQTASTAAVTGPIPELLKITQAMEQIEKEVRRLRVSLAKAEQEGFD